MTSFSRRDPVPPEGATHLNCYGYAEPIFLCLSHMPEVAGICLKSDHCTACEGISCNSRRSVQIGGPPFKCVMCTMKGQMIRHLASCGRKLEDNLEGIPTSFTTEMVHLAATGNDHRVFMEEVLRGAAEDEKAVAPKGSVSSMDKLFNGVWHCRTICRGCGYVWDEPMPFKLLSLDIEKATTLQEALSENFGLCDLSREDRCERCQGCLVEECAITMAPDALIIKLERLEARPKDLRHVDFDFDFNLDLAPYMAQYVSIPGGTRYQLTGIIEHRQEYLSTSYYTACVRGQKGEWRAMNNILLHEVSVEEVRRRQPYILFYSRGDAKLPSQADVLEAPMVPPGNKEATTPFAAIDAQLPKTPPRQSVESPMPKTLPPKVPQRVQRQLQLTPSKTGCAPSPPQPTVVEMAPTIATKQPTLATPPLPHQPSSMEVPPLQQSIDAALLQPQEVKEAPILTPPRLQVPRRAELQSGLFPPKTPSTQQATVAKGSQQTMAMMMQQPAVVTLPHGHATHQKRSRDEERAGDGKPQTPPTPRSRRCTKSLEPGVGSRKRKSNALHDGSGDTFIADTGIFHRLAKLAKTMARRLTGSRDASGSGNSSASTANSSTRSISATAIASSVSPPLAATENLRPMKEIIADLRRIRAECSHSSARGVSSAS